MNVTETTIEEFDSCPTIYRLKENGTVITEQCWNRFEGYYKHETIFCDNKEAADFYWPELVERKSRDVTSPDYDGELHDALNDEEFLDSILKAV